MFLPNWRKEWSKFQERGVQEHQDQDDLPLEQKGSSRYKRFAKYGVFIWKITRVWQKVEIKFQKRLNRRKCLDL